MTSDCFSGAQSLGSVQHSIHHDVALGLWVTSLAPGLTYVSMYDLGMQDRRGYGRYTTFAAEPLLVAHRLPPACWANASRHTSLAPASVEASSSIYSPTGLADRLHATCKDDEKSFASWTRRPPDAVVCAYDWARDSLKSPATPLPSTIVCDPKRQVAPVVENLQTSCSEVESSSNG